MPLFYFDLQTQNGLESDDIGLHLESAEDAYLAAYETIPSMANELLWQGRTPWNYAFKVRNAAGDLLWEVPFSERLDRPQTLRRRS